MDPRWRHPHGLRLTLRHLMILVVYFAVLFALIAPLERGGHYGLMSFLLPLTPPLLALLVVVFERPGPAKFWFAGVLVSLAFPAFVAWADLIGLFAWTAGVAPGEGWVVLVVLNLFGLASLAWFARRLPRRCPGCGLKAFLPLGGRFPRVLWWCASCGFRQPTRH
jgi:hypothetical protein